MNKQKLIEFIIKKLISDRSLVLVGPNDSGKSWFVTNELLPTIEKRNLQAQYIKECDDSFQGINNADIAIIDEVETLIDKDFLEQRHPKERPYYDDKYVGQVNNWFKKLKGINIPAIFIITRNDKEEISYLVKHLNVTDWGQKVTTLPFSRTDK